MVSITECPYKNDTTQIRSFADHSAFILRLSISTKQRSWRYFSYKFVIFLFFFPDFGQDRIHFTQLYRDIELHIDWPPQGQNT